MSMDIQDAAELLHTLCRDSADLLLPCCRGATEINCSLEFNSSHIYLLNLYNLGLNIGTLNTLVWSINNCNKQFIYHNIYLL